MPVLASRGAKRHRGAPIGDRVLKPDCSFGSFALARARVERHTQCQCLLAGCTFSSLELAGDLGGWRLLPRERFEFAYVLRGPLPPFRLLDHHDLRGFALTR